MERGAKALARMLVIALLLGLVILFVHRDFRQTAVAMIHGQPESSPIWLSNQAYYSEVHFVPERIPDDAIR